MGLRPAFKVTANDRDITAKIQDRLISIVITDEAGLAADMLEVQLADNDPASPIQKPPKGAELEAWLGYDTQLQRMGLFVCDEVEIGGFPGYITIRARAATYEGTPKGKTDLQSQKKRSWPRGTKLGAMARKIAKEHGMEAAVAKSLDALVLPHLDQTAESDLSFLVRVLKPYDAIVKPAGGKLLVAKLGEAKAVSGAQLPTVTVQVNQVASFRLIESSRENPGTVVAQWNSRMHGKLQEVIVGTGEPVRRLRHTYPTREAAEKAAQAELDKRKRGLNRINLTLEGNPVLSAEGILVLQGFRPDVTGEWLISRVQHNLGGGGYSCEVEAERPQE